MNNVLVVAPHPDDETLGVGGTLLKHISRGDKLHWLIMTHPKDNDHFSQQFVEERDRQIEMVANSYPFATHHVLDFKAAMLDSYDLSQLVGAVGKVISDIQPNIVYIPFGGDIHSDHKITFDVLLSCTKRFRFPFIKEILSYETLSETDQSPASGALIFSPTVYVDITDFLQQKLEIFLKYKTEVADHPFPRSIENISALATYRGGQVFVKNAEAFMLLRLVDC